MEKQLNKNLLNSMANMVLDYSCLENFNIKGFVNNMDDINSVEYFQKLNLIKDTFELLNKEITLFNLPAINCIRFKRYSLLNRKAIYIGIMKNIVLSEKMTMPIIIHEFFHHLDMSLSNKKYKFISFKFNKLRDQLLSNLMDTNTVKSIRRSKLIKKKKEYLLDDKEMFARVLSDYLLSKHNLYDYNAIPNNKKIVHFNEYELSCVSSIIDEIFSLVNSIDKKIAI